MYVIKPSTRFKKDLKLVAKRGFNIDKLTRVIKQLSQGETLDEKYKDHSLTGNWADFRECHITPDWLLVY